MPRNFIDPQLVNETRQTMLNALPPDAPDTITRKELCKKLDLDPRDGVVFSRMLDFGLLPEFEDRGTKGIGRKGVRPLTPSDRLDHVFIQKMEETLAMELTRSASITREKLAAAMGMPGLETMQKISVAFAAGKLPNYDIKQGQGICKKKG